jgi:A/G-specific adenine glycosylase
MSRLASRIIEWQRRHGRHDLPWQGTRDPYRIWVSEIMLQQTQVAAVVPYYLRFVERFPDVATLAAAPLDDVLALWSGLGYYSRARNLHACARRVVAQHGGRFPREPAALAELPGIGESTAAAIAAFAFGERAAILDGNVKRVFCRCFGVEGYPGSGPVQRRLWEIARRELPASGVEAYTQGLMDLGATLCTRSRPGCPSCPLSDACVALAQGRVGSLPAPRPRKPVPQKRVAMLVALSGGDVLLCKRPPQGIWGGLWSLPEVPLAPGADADTAAVDSLLAAQGLRAAAPGVPLPAFTHAFTHYRLEVSPVLAEVRQGAAADPAASVWLPLGEVDDAALPRPVKSLLQRLRGQRPDPVRPPGAAAGTGAPGPAWPADPATPSASASPGSAPEGSRKGGLRPTLRSRTRRARRPPC